MDEIKAEQMEPLVDHEEDESVEPTVDHEDESVDTPPQKSMLPFIVGGVVALALILIGAGILLLSLGSGEAAETAGAAPVAAESADEEIVDGETAIPGEVLLDVSGDTAVESVAVGEFAELSTLPPSIVPKSNVYTIAGKPVGTAAVTVPGGVQANTDLYGWDGRGWQFVPSRAEGTELVTLASELPQALVVVERSSPESVAVAADVSAESALPTDLLPLLTEVNAGGLVLAEDGALEGEAAEVPQGGYGRLLHVTNAGVIVDQTTLSNLLADPDMRAAHIDAIVNAAVENEYSGVNLDYQGVVAQQKSDFTDFVAELKAALEVQGLSLAVTLGTPDETGDGSWETAGQDWVALGQMADTIYVQMPLDPTAYGDGGRAEQLLSWATRRIDRAKLTALVSANAIDKLGGVMREVSLPDALQNLGALEIVSGETDVDVETPVAFAFTGSATPLEWDGDSLTYKYAYAQDGQERTVWISNEAAVAYRLRLAARYGLRGVAVRGLSHLENGKVYANALASYADGGDTPQPEGAAIVWTVENEEGGVIASSSGEALTFEWDGIDAAGAYVVNAGFAQGETAVPLGTLELSVGDLAAAEAEETAAEEAEADDEAATPEEEAEAPAEAEGEEVAIATSGAKNGVVNTGANVRLGPGINYGTIAGGANPDTEVEIIGRSQDSLWYQVIFGPENTEGWIYSTLVDVDAALDIAALPVPAVDPPQPQATVATAPAAGGGESSGGGDDASASQPAPGSSSAPPAPVAPANLSGGFELGGQTHTLANPQLMQHAGMTWVKFQHKWGPGNNPNDVAGRIQQAHANGLKVLLSIPGSPYPSSIDFDSYVQFLGGVAALGPDAIEVWNEMNIDFEWPAGQIDPASYVNNMLAPAYNAIKSANPNVMVISGALAPTGFDNGTNAWSDARYIQGMAAAGAANYMDCIGVHHNAGATSPHQSSGHPANSGHYSWYFQPTLNLYYNAFGGSRKVCFTELGYLSGEGWGSLPSNFSWAGNTTIAQHAQWLAEAASISANSGKVRLLIVFNVDFTLFDGSDPQAGFAMVRKDGSCPACDALSQVMGGG